MSSRRKKTTPPPPSLPSPLRRSGRHRSQRNYCELEDGNDASDAEAVENTRTGRDASEVWGRDGRVEGALKELSEMERWLQNATKRQRIDVETSDIMTGADGSRHPSKRRRKDTSGEEGAHHLKYCLSPSSADPQCSPMRPEDTVAAAADISTDTQALRAGDEVPDRGAARPPPVNSGYLPLPWKGRLGYACLNTYLRAADPPVFSSRTCRIASIIEHRHPLAEPSRPEHPSKNRPDMSKPASVERGLEYVHALGLSNARDVVKMLKWNDKYGIKFLRLSSDMFPFASHEDHGYKLEPFASKVLAEVGSLAARLGHRLTVHPGQYTQLGSPRPAVIAASIRDLEYHDEMLTLLRLPEQQDMDAVMVLHMGGTYGDKAATLDRFRTNYARLSASVRRRLVLENDDVAWSVHDLLPICEELNIPLVLDFHHHNIIFAASAGIREGTADVVTLFRRIKETWTRKGITQKMHYSEACVGAMTPRERRKHSARVRTLPPCEPDMDLMIEAKDKEQAVFDLMRNFKLPGWDRFNDIIPYQREDTNRAPKSKKCGEGLGNGVNDGIDAGEDTRVSEDDFGMGGPMRRVYWPEGMEQWLRPKKRDPKVTRDVEEMRDDGE